MRAVVMRERTLACGICGSDRHALKHADALLGIVKELSLQFVLGYTREEFAATLEHIADGRIAVAPLITGHVGIDGVAGAFEALATPERHAKIIVRAARG